MIVRARGDESSPGGGGGGEGEAGHGRRDRVVGDEATHIFQDSLDFYY